MATKTTKKITLTIPRNVRRGKTILDGRGELYIFIPFPNDDEKGIWVDRQDFVNLLRANKNNPDAIQYLADMLE